ncbi:MAG: methyltransferase domain-containing protein [Legionellales bacterium]|nr:methyltransferase domain-containing protein [Legionellales bacterium]
MNKLKHFFSRYFHQNAVPQAAFLVEEIGRRLSERIGILQFTPRRILDLTVNSPTLTQTLITHYPSATLYGLTSSPKHSLIRLQASPRQLPFASQSIDLILANLLLFSAEHLAAMMIEWRRLLTSNGVILFATYGIDSLKEFRQVANADQTITFSQNLLDMHDIGDAMLQAGFNDPVMDMEMITLQYPDKNQLCEEISRLNLRGFNPSPECFLEYPTLGENNHLFPASFEIIYGHAWGLKQRRQNGETRIPVDNLLTNFRRQ